MRSLEVLLERIQSDPAVQRFRELEALIDADVELQRQYKALLDLQKRMVQRESSGHPDAPAAKEAYELAKNELLDHVLLGEYLALLEQLNDDLQGIQNIIEQELEHLFD
jgi:cell fate (sporulation/competence/biofilm development) regulator YlbF (YheA/YmcA/DUF963 family)